MKDFEKNCLRMKHYESDEWSRNEEKATTQERLQEIAAQIRKGCKVTKINDMGNYYCTEFENENLGIRYWIHDSFGTISEIIEGRYY